ncbi:MAG: CNNM domain-containing protein [bacterium]
MLLIFASLFIVLIMGIFTASETSFLCVDKTKVFYAAEQNKRWAVITKRFVNKPSEFFSTILVCEDFLIVASSNLLALFFLRNFGENWVFVSTIILSVFSLIFGQLIPKSIALNYPEKTLHVTTDIIWFFRIFLIPIVVLLSDISQGIAGLFKGQSKSAIIRHQDIVSAISEYEKDMSLLTSRLFDFSKRKVYEVMVPITMTVACKNGEDFHKFCFESPKIFRYVPIYEGDKNNIIGVVNSKDYFLNNIIEIRPPFFVNENERCMHTFLKMKENKEFIAIVKNENNEVTGIITIYDLIEELVGAIREEK